MTIYECRIIYPAYAAKEKELLLQQQPIDNSCEREKMKNEPATSLQLGGPVLTPDAERSVEGGWFRL